MDPLGSTAGGFHGSALLGTQQTLWLHPQSTRPAQPAALWHLEDPIAGLWSHSTSPAQEKQGTDWFFSFSQEHQEDFFTQLPPAERLPIHQL
jgi:hypothetical protein